jgi:hypothetical protein
MNAHTNLQLHLSRHIYKRGRFTGDAPADGAKRYKVHFRVIKGNGGQMLVRLHNTDLITAYEDGRIIINTNGWYSSSTTKQNLNQAMQFVGAGYTRIYARRKWGQSHTVIHAGGKTHLYYDGMEFDANMKLLSDPKEFKARRIDKDETAEFRREIKESGFADVFAVLYAVATPDTGGWFGDIAKAMTREYMAHQWPTIIANHKFQNYQERVSSTPHYDSPQKALRALIARVTKTMTCQASTGVTVL